MPLTETQRRALATRLARRSASLNRDPHHGQNVGAMRAQFLDAVLACSLSRCSSLFDSALSTVSRLFLARGHR